MEKRITTKDVQIGDSTYRVTKMDPRTACWLFATLGARAGTGSLLSAIGQLSRPDFDSVQTSALACVSRVDVDGANEHLMPVMMASGAVVDSQAQEDASVLFRLTAESIQFSLDPFIAGNASSSPATVE